jgi:uncharacterized protein (TIGR00251 family)
MLIHVKVIPNSKKYQVEKISDDYFKVRVNAKAENGRANKRLVEIISEYFKVSKSSVVILKGLKSRNKIIEIRLT